MKIKYLPDPDFCRRLLDGDERAFRDLFERFYPKIYQFAFNFLKRRDLSEEIVQQTFLSFWQNRAQLDVDRPVAPLLFTIARRVLIDSWRKQAVSARFREDVVRHMSMVSNETEEHILSNDLAKVTEEALRKLTEQQQEVFRLSRYEGLSYEEIAERLRISKHTVKYHLVNALKIVKEHLKKYDIGYLYLLFLLAG